MIDMHIHTTASDGTDTPKDTVKKAAEIGLIAIAITDHDTVSGVSEAMETGKQYNIEVIPGIEISADYNGTEVHILGYFINPCSPELKPALDWVVTDRNMRNEHIIKKLSDDGYDISLTELKEKHKGTVLGRPHIAEHLLNKGYVNSIQQAFDEFLAEGKPYFLPRTYLPINKAIDVICSAGGVAVIAHPLQYGFNDSELHSFLLTAKRFGAVGIETIYSKYTETETEYLMQLAKDLNMFKTGGSDYHGTRKPNIKMGIGTGKMNVPDSYLDILKEGI